MGALISLPVTLLNFLLPFTKPGTPLLQDLVHTAILCGTLYFAPQIAEWYNKRQAQNAIHEPREGANTRLPGTETEDETPQDDDAPVDERFVLQDDGDEMMAGPPPFAPTPPPNRAEPLRQQPPAPRVDDDVPDAFAPGPADPPAQANGPRPTPANRTVGAKKAKSLARKDQRRAYHEFHRQEAELRRLQEAEGAEEREAALAAERERRARIEEEIREREREERDKAKREREREADEENARRERVVLRVREVMQQRGAADLVDVAWTEGKDKIWVERLVRASGLLSQLQKDGAHVVITGPGWLVKVDTELMKQAYADAQVSGERNGGKVTFSELGGILEKAVLGRAKA
ncbi:uncharacterized protein K460DRAFT_287768 [Cucurbitaria berberidis CBS 394.84]|uniref:Uncharacterized protein n=1 Tax=Cucurbitaria berberidis CBS 394.84 TaxID=1168544 RepID=A0A9P4L6W7_9PLEO|nr:uncharacterized protein K460DRAFT_287768 [Cucurbitaria berberidis CBS 394.84]KAF1844265.1 hypothetical protein K460DRAFT_287768 [Cucurbitaria berberidis CBS 394.84]